MYKRVLLKLSGEALSDGKNNLFCQENLQNVSEEIKEVVNSGIQVCIVVGGGNIYRGKIGETLGMNRVIGDSMGMLATVMNSLALQNQLIISGVDCVVMSSIQMNGIATLFDVNKAIKALNKNKVVIFAAGTGLPYFSTDTCSALRALQVNCDVILMAKNGVDGVYDSDPRINKNAVKFDTITYQEVIERNLQVMDQTATSLCKDNKMPLVVFNMNKKGNIVKACMQKIDGTLIK